jgi:hypothetical protein
LGEDAENMGSDIVVDNGLVAFTNNVNANS